MSDKEIWKDIEGYNNLYKGLYQVSNMGRVRRMKILKPHFNSSGYYIVSLVNNKKAKTCRIHRLVARAFIPNPENKPEVNHISGMKTDNTVDNLEWCTGKENSLHAVNIGLTPCGANNYRAKFTNEQIKQIRKEYVPHDRDFGAAALSKKYHVEKSTIYKIIHHKTYKNID